MYFDAVGCHGCHGVICSTIMDRTSGNKMTGSVWLPQDTLGYPKTHSCFHIKSIGGGLGGVIADFLGYSVGVLLQSYYIM